MRLSDKLRSIGLAVILTWGWKRAVLALAAGALSSLAMAPFNAWPVLFLTFSIAVWLIDGAAAGRWRGVPAAAMSGFWFGLGYFVPGLYWIGYAFFVDADTFAWLTPFAVLGLPAYLALFTAFGFALARLIWPRDASRVLALAVSLTISRMAARPSLERLPVECVRLRADRTVGVGTNCIMLIGLWGMTFLAVAIFASPAVLIDGTSRGRKAVARTGGRGAGSGSNAGVWRGPPVAGADQHGRWRQAAHHAARSAAGCQVQLLRQGGGDAEISHIVGPGLGSALDRCERRHHPDLAGIRVSVLPDARSRRDGANRRRCCRREPC